MVRTDIDTATLPGFKHLISTVPVALDHDAIVRCLVELSHLFLTELDTLVVSAHVGVVLMRCGELGLEVFAGNFHRLSMEQLVQGVVADCMLSYFVEGVRMVLQFEAHVLDDTLHIILTDVLSANLEARPMLECAHEIMWAHDLLVLVEMAAFWDVSVHVFNDDWV